MTLLTIEGIIATFCITWFIWNLMRCAKFRKEVWFMVKVFTWSTAVAIGFFLTLDFIIRIVQ